MSVGDSAGVRSFGGSGGGSSSGIAIGDPVTGGAATSVLFVDDNGDLAQAVDGDSNFEFYFLVAEDSRQLAIFNASAVNNHTSVVRISCGDGLTVFNDITLSAKNNVGPYLELASLTATFDLLVDTADSNKLKARKSGQAIWQADGTTFEVVDVLKINNTVTAEVAAASTHKVAINIGGTNYYALLLAA